MDGGYKTRQREIVEAFLRAHEAEHLSAGEIARGLAGKVGMATIYRTLTRLEAEGRVRKYLETDERGALYQYVDSPACQEHFHLRCLECGRLIHLDCEFIDQLCSHVETKHHFKLDTTKTVLYGHCGCGGKK